MTEAAFKLNVTLFLRFCSLPFLADYMRFLNRYLWSNLSCCVSGPLLRLKSFCWLWKCRLKSQKGTGQLPSREQSVEVRMNRKVLLVGKWTIAKHDNMGWCTFSVVSWLLAVCSFSLCCLFHSVNTSACMAAWWVRSSWNDPAKKIALFFFFWTCYACQVIFRVHDLGFRAGNWSEICHTVSSTALSNQVPAVPSM